MKQWYLLSYVDILHFIFYMHVWRAIKKSIKNEEWRLSYLHVRSYSRRIVHLPFLTTDSLKYKKKTGFENGELKWRMKMENEMGA